MKISINQDLKQAFPLMQIGIITCAVENTDTPDKLWNAIEEEARSITNEYQMSDIAKRPAIAATRNVYKHFGKDPNRYRVSSEALCRRIVRGMELYRINTLVDLINLLSIRSGYSIGGFDADKIKGDLELGIGIENEPYEAIHRGQLNIGGIPVFRDSIGGIGTPTSDNERTCISIDTKHILITINAYAEEYPLNDFMEWCKNALKEYASASNIASYII